MHRAMRVMVGERPSQKIRRICECHGWGEMYVYSRPRENFAWSGFDNGAYLDWINERPFDETRYRMALDIAMSIGIPYMAVVPDLVTGGDDSLEFSMRWLDKLPAYWPWYLVLQDGMRTERVEAVLHLFHGLFLGGSDQFKASAQHWCNLAHFHGKRFHFGRAGTESKLKTAINIGADSLDSGFPLWTIERMRRMEYLVNEWEVA